MRCLILGGFLGSGKTSLLLQLASYMRGTLGIEKTVILENEIGQVGIDDNVLSGSGYNVQGMFAGCVCCTLAGELPTSIRAIEKDINPDWIIMEATGVAFPYSIAENLKGSLGMECRIVTLADAQRWNRLVKAMSHLFVYQMKDADVVLANKADLVDADTLNEVIASIKEVSGCEEVVPTCANEGIDSKLLDRIITGEA